MLATPAEIPFSDAGWLFEPKYDGWRLLASSVGGRPRLRLRGGGDATETFPEVASALGALRCEGLILDGEVVVVDERGRPSFGLLQRRAGRRRATDAARASVEAPSTFFAFDILACEGRDLRSLPIEARKAILALVVPDAGAVRLSAFVEGRGEELFREAVRLGFEGVVAKRLGEPYRGGRSSAWRKVKREPTGDFLVVGFTAPRGSRGGFGALELASLESGRLVHVGRVGAGFTQEDLEATRPRLEGLRRATAPCEGAPTKTKGRGPTWVEPVLVCEVRYHERTEAGALRKPVFLRFREDKAPAECAPEAETATKTETRAAASSGEAAPRAALTSLDKVYWPEEGYTKGDLLAYYRGIWPHMAPYLRDRPLVLDRFPEGILGKSFYQKHAPASAPPWVRTVSIASETPPSAIRYFVAEDVESLLHVVNSGSIPIHIWQSRAAAIERPDWCVIDLDPKGASFARVIEITLALKELCDRVGLPALLKTSGKTGLHIMIPLGGRADFEESRALGEVLARITAARLSRIATVERSIAARGGRVYVDFLQNRRGALIVAPYAVRPVAGATVSTPLEWREVGARLDPSRFTIRSVPKRVAKLGADPLRAVLDAGPDLERALALLTEHVRGTSGAG